MITKVDVMPFLSSKPSNEEITPDSDHNNHLFNGQQRTVSAVIPTRNRPELVRRAVRSALDQTYRQIEVIVVVDGPDPETVNLLRGLYEPRLRIIDLPESVGGSEARNLGARQANGEWIAFLDDDDEWLPEKIQRQVEAAEQFSGQVLLGCRFVEKTENGERHLPLRLPGTDEPLSEYLYCPSKFSLGEGFVQTSSVFVSRSLLLSVPFVTGLKCGQETTWLLKVVRETNVRLFVLPDVLCVFYDDRSRSRVSDKPNWRSLHNWARNNRQYFTKRAYSFFIATTCATYARKNNESIKVLLSLLIECIRDGSPSFKCLALFFCRGFMPTNIRRRLGSILDKRKNPAPLAQQISIG